MKASKFRQILNGLATTLEAFDRGESAAAMRAFAKGFGGAPSLELEAFFAALDFSRVRGGHGAKLQTVLGAIESIGPLVDAIASPAARASIHSLSVLLAKNRNMSIQSYLSAVQSAFSTDLSSLLNEYVEELRQTVHDAEKFPGAVRKIEKLNREDVVAIASAFAFEMAKSTSKKAALERIWRMHSASESFAAKSRAMKGKSAA